MTNSNSRSLVRSGKGAAPRRGLTLVELLVTMVLVAIVGAAFTRLLIYHSRFLDAQNNERQARGVSRGALNVMMSELRMVTVPNGVVAAAIDSVVVRVPYAFGVLCGSSAVASTISLVPMDSLAYTESGVTGYAWRDSTGNYAYVNAAFTMAPGLATSCTAATVGITTLTGGKVVTVTPVVPAAARPGTPIFLYRRIEYKFGASVAMPGRRALWRKNATMNTREELVAPFDASARFRFFVDGSNASQANPPILINELRGLELRLAGASDRATMSTSAPATSELQAAVFFMNRLP
jgi:prepilin-type N-terminal cleavage/methylation domain-containing protein